jgi:hypothetical protein
MDAQRGMAAVGADHKIGADFQFAVRRCGAHADDTPALLDQAGDLGAHAQVEGGIALPVLGNEIEEIPLRHQRNVFAHRRQMGKVADGDARRADLAGQMIDARMRQPEKFLEQAEFMHQLERRRMDGVAAEVAQKVGVLLQHRHADAGTRQQKAEHHAGRAAADNAAGGLDRNRIHRGALVVEPAGRRPSRRPVPR